MKNRNMIYLNCLIYVVIIFLVIGKFIYDIVTTGCYLKISYYLIVGSLPILMAIVIIGLILKKDWARSWAIVLNLFTAFLLIGLNIVLFMIFNSDMEKNQLVQFDLDTIFRLALGVILIFLAIVFFSRSMKEYFYEDG